MKIEAIESLLIIGGFILLTDATTSLMYVRDKRWFCQVVRLERFIFAVLLIIAGVLI